MIYAYDPRTYGQEPTNERLDQLVNYSEKRAKQIVYREKLERKAKQLEAEHKRKLAKK